MTTRLALALLTIWTTAYANPIVTNLDKISYAGHLACHGASEGQEVTAGLTKVFTEYVDGGNCFLEIYLPARDPFGPDGGYDPKKRVSRAKVQRDSECVVQRKKLLCD